MPLVGGELPKPTISIRTGVVSVISQSGFITFIKFIRIARSSPNARSICAGYELLGRKETNTTRNSPGLAVIAVVACITVVIPHVWRGELVVGALSGDTLDESIYTVHIYIYTVRIY